MAKKKIIGSSKLSKPHDTVEQTGKPLNLLKKNKEVLPKSFRLFEEDIKRLKEITENVNRESSMNLSETKILRALIYIGFKTPSSRIYKAFKDII